MNELMNLKHIVDGSEISEPTVSRIDPFVLMDCNFPTCLFKIVLFASHYSLSLIERSDYAYIDGTFKNSCKRILSIMSFHGTTLTQTQIYMCQLYMLF